MNAVIPIVASEHPIKSVTIFKSTKLAEIVRTFEVDLKAGQTKIEITGLPTALDHDSVRVTGLGSGSGSALRLYDFVCTISSKDTPVIGEASATSINTPTSTQTILASIPTLSDPAECIRLLKSHLKTLESEKRVREHEADLLVSYAKTLNGEHTKPDEMSKFLSTFVETGQKNLVAVRNIGEQIIEVQRHIEIEEERNAKKKGTLRARVDVVVGNGEKGKGEDRKVELKLTYIVSNATWEPTYELHATTSPSTGQPSAQVTLHYRARITQSTGEDWTDAALTLSTGSSFGFGQSFGPKDMPTLRGVKILPAAGNLFQSGGGLFGNGNRGGFGAKPAQAPASNSLFGAARAQHNLPNQASSNGPQQQQQPQLAFSEAPIPAPNQNRSIFGQTSAFQPPAQFPIQQNTSAAGASLFGGAPAPTASSAFGAASSTTAQPAEDVSSDIIGGDFEEIPLPSGPAGPDASPSGNLGDELSQGQTVVTETPLAISYSVEGKATIPSDGVNHHVGVAVLPFGSDKESTGDKNAAVRVEYGVVPRADTRVYLQCRVKNTSEYRLLPGSVSVILNDTYVARSQIGHVNPNDTFTCTLGTDATTSVTYSRKSRSVRSSTGSFTEAFNTTTYTTEVTLSNRHAFDLNEVRIRDAVPMWSPSGFNEADKNRVKVVLRKPEGLADAKDGQVVNVKREGEGGQNVNVTWQKEKEGTFEWKVKVPAGKKETLVLEWEVKAPADLPVVERLSY